MPKKKTPPPPPNKPGNKLWSHIEGKRRVNRIRVYEKYEGSQIWVDWHDDDGRHREPLLTARGMPIYDRALAVLLCQKMADAQMEVRQAQASSELLGIRRVHPLREVLDTLHRSARAKKWLPSYRRDQERFKRFWLAQIGEDTPIEEITPNKVERVAQLAAEANEWSPRTLQSYLRYIVDVFYYAQHKLKLIDEYHNLSAVEFPKYETDNSELAYTLDQVNGILDASKVGDPRVTAAGEITFAGMRRLDAIRKTGIDAVSYDDDGKMKVFMPRANDKAKKSGYIYLARRGRLAVEKLLASPAVQASKLLMPAGDLNDPNPDREPISREDLIKGWHEAEVIAGVPWVKGRAFNGVIRRAVTISDEEAGTLSTSKQSGKSEQIIPRYRQDSPEPRKRVAEVMEKKRRAR